MPDRDSAINDLNVAKLILCNPQMLTPEMCIRIGQAITSALALLKEQEEQIKNRDESLEKAREEIKWLREMLKEQEAVEPEVEVLNEIDRLYRCPRCHKCFFYEKQKYCDQCGQEVKWE